VSESAAAPRTSSRPRRTPSARRRLTVAQHVGETGRDAAQAVRRAGLNPALELLAIYEGVIPGTVVAQDPEAGSELARGELVRLYISPPATNEPPAQPPPAPTAQEPDAPRGRSTPPARRSRKRGVLPAVDLPRDLGPEPTIHLLAGQSDQANQDWPEWSRPVAEAGEGSAPFAAGAGVLELAEQAFTQLRNRGASASSTAELRSRFTLLAASAKGLLGGHRLLWISTLVIALVSLLIAASAQRTNKPRGPSTHTQSARTKPVSGTRRVRQARHPKVHHRTRDSTRAEGHHVRASAPQPPPAPRLAGRYASTPVNAPVEAAPEGEPEQSGGGLFSP
jgi:hypothetical protein